ncbi:MAG: RecB family exonuclease [Armatimonadota bacterium]
MRLSYSKLNTYRQCPLRYRFTYLDRLPRRPRRLFRASRHIHHALMRWLTYARSGQPRWEEAKAAYDSAWGVLQDPALADSADYREGLEIVRAYHEANAERPCRPVHLEHKFSVPLGPHVLIGSIDRVDATDSGYEVIDYKLDRDLRPQEVVDEDLQLGLYYLGLQEGQGIRPEALSLYFLRHNVARTTLRTRQQMADLSHWVIDTGNAITADRRWEPCSGDHCGGCDFRSVCPVHTDVPLPPLPQQRQPIERQMSLHLPGLGEEPMVVVETAGAEETSGTQLALPLV